MTWLWSYIHTYARIHKAHSRLGHPSLGDDPLHSSMDYQNFHSYPTLPNPFSVPMMLSTSNWSVYTVFIGWIALCIIVKATVIIVSFVSIYFAFQASNDITNNNNNKRKSIDDLSIELNGKIIRIF